MENKIIIFKELNLADYSFNLKSATSGKYSVHDSYRENYSNGFLVNINAPADVNNALKDIYYATDKGQVISYQEFNNKIISMKNQILSETFPGKELKDLPKDERIKTERDSAKRVLKEFSINESTKLIYSPELTLLKQEYEKDYKLKFIPENLKIIFYNYEKTTLPEETGSTKNDNDISTRKKEINRLFLDFSEKIKPLVENAISSHNLDELELTLLELDKYYNNLPRNFQEIPEIESYYEKNKTSLSGEANLIKEEQVKLEEFINNKVNDLLNKKEYKKIKQVILEIKNEFSENPHINNDTKSKNIKDLAIEKLSNAGKVITLIVKKDWNSKNLNTSDALLKQNLPLELENILIKKHEQELIKVKTEEEKLKGIDFHDSNLIYTRFRDLVRYNYVFNNLFDMITAKGFEDINFIITELGDNYANFLILLANNLPFEKFSLLWKHLSPQVIEKIVSNRFPYSAFKNARLIDLYFETLLSSASPEIIIEIFNKIKIKTINSFETPLLLKVIFKLQTLEVDIVNFFKKVYPEKILDLFRLEQVNQNTFLKNILVETLIKWFPSLDIEQPEFTETLLKFPMQAIEKLRKNQIDRMSPEFTLKVLEALENNKDAMHYFAYQVGKEKYDAALKIKLKSLVIEYPASYENHFNLGITYFNTKDYSSAVLEFKRALGINPELPEGHFYLGFTFEKLEKFDLAMSEYKKAISKKYGYIEAYFNLGLLYNKLNDRTQAIQQFKKIQKIDPDNYDAAVNLGITYDDMGDIDNAIREYERAIAIKPEKTTSYMNLANCYSLKGNDEAAIEHYNKVINYEPENALVQYNLGILYQNQKNYSMAKAHYKMAIRFDNNYSEAYNNLGLVYFFLVRLPEAIEMWKKSIELNDNIDAYNNLGWGYYVVGELDKSVEIYEKAKKINPKHSILSLNLGTVYLKKDEIEKAIKELENYLILEPEASTRNEVAEILKSLKITNETTVLDKT